MPVARFLLDRSLGQRALIARLRTAGWDARTLAEEFGDHRAQGMRDEEWIREGTDAGFVLLAKDHRIASRPLEAQSIARVSAQVVVFARGDLTAVRMGDLCLEFADRIHELGTKPGPYVYSIAAHGLTRKRLNLSI